MEDETLFSKQADRYARFRPGYPPELYDYILSFVRERERAWDCATGNGQAARELASRFRHVDATDIAVAQLQQAPEISNVSYTIAPADHTPFPDHCFDLITVAQAYHWFQPDLFRKEANRVGKEQCVVAVWMYSCCTTGDTAINQLIDHFHHDITREYWDPRRKWVDEEYRTISFDFAPLPEKQFAQEYDWTAAELLGYFSSWSATQRYIDAHGHSPLGFIAAELTILWGDQTRRVHFPIHLRLGRTHS